ncbi:GNAT family N-acetyltransferase [Arthrobacter monumenti]
MDALRLRPLTMADEKQALLAQHELDREDFTFLLGFQQTDSWTDHLLHLENARRGIDVPEGRVPATFLVAEADGQLVGRVSIRHCLNDFLLQIGGHIGYAVRPAFRRKGYGTQILQQSLDVARGLGIRQALVTCDADNLGSIRIIESTGAQLDEPAALGNGTPPKHRYWIAT